MPAEETPEIILKGIGGSPGICIGKAYLVDKEGVDIIEKYQVPSAYIDNEINRFKSAVMHAKDELRAIFESSPEEVRRHAQILETHIVLLEDKMLFNKTIETIRKEKINAEWALKMVVSDVKSMFSKMSDPYLKERVADIEHVSDRIMRLLLGAADAKIDEIKKRVILVAEDLSPADTSQIQLEKVMGFITDRGGKASHTSIIARSLEIPAVLGLGDVTAKIDNDDLIILDGSAGIVIIHPSEESLVLYEERIADYEARKASMIRGSHLAAETADGIRIRVMGNIERPEEVASVLHHGGDGIGLYRTEFQYMNRPVFPQERELFENYREVVEIMAPNPVTIRTLDINGDKAVQGASGSDEVNPALGMRAIRYCLSNPDVFITQIRALLRAAVFGNVRMMLPLISNTEEILEVKRLIDTASDQLEKEGLRHRRDVQLGILIEVPSAVVMADKMAEHVDFFSIGTNDLIQYTLAIDRGNKDVAHMYQPLNPAIMRMLDRVTGVARKKGIKVFMCGEMAGDPMYLPILLGLGLDELSMNPSSIPMVKRTVRLLEIEDARCFMKTVLEQSSASKTIQALETKYGEKITGLYE